MAGVMPGGPRARLIETPLFDFDAGSNTIASMLSSCAALVFRGRFGTWNAVVVQ